MRSVRRKENLGSAAATYRAPGGHWLLGVVFAIAKRSSFALSLFVAHDDESMSRWCREKSSTSML